MYLKLFLALFIISSLGSSYAQSETKDTEIIIKVLTNKKIILNTETQVVEGLYKHTLTEDEFINLASFNELLYDAEYADIDELDVCYVGDQIRALQVIKLAYIKNQGTVITLPSNSGLHTVKLLQPKSISIDNLGTITIDSITHVTDPGGLESTGSTDVYFLKCSY